MRPFLTAEWRNLILLTYAVDPDLLSPYLPPGLELDLINNRAFVSFVAFDFRKTRVKGIPIPFHINFPEINLRFYVHDGDRRGVVFIKELVPRYWIARIAKSVYNEPYEAINMRLEEKIIDQQLIIKHDFKYQGQAHSLVFTAENKPYFPKENSTEAFFKEHEWGFGTDAQGKRTEYKVEHPIWKIYPLKKRFELNVDFGQIYGEQWEILTGQIPYNVLVAEGSPIKVFPKKKS